jgi:hypothetical protein
LPRIFVNFASKESSAIGTFPSNDFGAGYQSGIVNKRTATFARNNILCFAKTEGIEIAKAAQRAVFVFRAHALGGGAVSVLSISAKIRLISTNG